MGSLGRTPKYSVQVPWKAKHPAFSFQYVHLICSRAFPEDVSFGKNVCSIPSRVFMGVRDFTLKLKKLSWI